MHVVRASEHDPGTHFSCSFALLAGLQVYQQDCPELGSLIAPSCTQLVFVVCYCRFGSVLENVEVNELTREVDYMSNAITENTRASYPIDFIDNAKIPCVGPQPRNVVLLCCDAFGVLPPVSRLSLEQVMYHFISGYTSKVAGTEMGITEPEATFSACYGGAFLMWHPMKYAAMLAEKMQKHGTKGWLVNTGWTGGSYGVGSRISLKFTRAIIDAIHSGALDNVEYVNMPIFNLQVPTSCPGVPSVLLQPSLQWADKADFNDTLSQLATLFVGSFRSYLEDAAMHVGAEMAERILSGGPDMRQVGIWVLSWHLCG
eukprot:GHUV01035825.1.p1 GENE.GHUV01035825.1~~GHUV01035825.1.p1  ORF type:complete len:315 (+),score=92.73 GHUV01035825.1:1591-2535(+)